jgi:hypothetical protein
MPICYRGGRVPSKSTSDCPVCRTPELNELLAKAIGHLSEHGFVVLARDSELERHPKWERVQWGDTIPAGQPYRYEFRTGVHSSEKWQITIVEQGESKPFTVESDHPYYVDSTWEPLKIPTATGSVIRAEFDGRITFYGKAPERDRWVVLGSNHPGKLFDIGVLHVLEVVFDRGAER